MASWAADDFEAIKGRLEELRRHREALFKGVPRYKGGSSAPNCHCTFCPKPPQEQCALSCSVEYKSIYGIDAWDQKAQEALEPAA